MKKGSQSEGAKKIFFLVPGGSRQREGIAKLISLGLSFLFHVSLATLVGAILTAVGIAIANSIAKSVPSYLRYVAEIVELSVFLTPGFILGFVVNNVAKRRTACWVWLAGAGWLTLGVYESVQRYIYNPRWYGTCSLLDNITNTFILMDQAKCAGGSEVLDGVVFTLPAVSSVTYALGAWVAIHRGRSNVKSA